MSRRIVVALVVLGVLGLLLGPARAQSRTSGATTAAKPSPRGATALSPSPTAGAYQKLPRGNQKIARALYEAQPRGTTGSRRMTLDHIAALKQTGQGWGQVFKSMKAQGLVQEKNLGQVVSSYNRRHKLSSSSVTTGSNRTSSSRDYAGSLSKTDGGKRAKSSTARPTAALSGQKGEGKNTMSSAPTNGSRGIGGSGSAKSIVPPSGGKRK